MRLKKNIIVICSWLDVETKIGSFFWEQADFLKDDFNVFLCTFKKKKGLGKFFWRDKFIEKHLAPNGLDVYYIYHPHIDFLSEKNNIRIKHLFIKRFYLYLKKTNFNFALIHAQSIRDAGIEALFLSKLSSVPFVFTEHNQLSFRHTSFYQRKYFNEVIDKASIKMVVSFDKIRQFATNGIFSNFKVIGNAVDSKIFHYNKEDKSLTESKEVFKLITIGAYNPIKDQETMLKALLLLDNKLDVKVDFTWIGYNSWGSNQHENVTKLLNKYRFNNIKVNLFPYLEKEKVAIELKKSDLFLFSSLAEGMPVSVLEALGCGVPVCTTFCGGVEEIINDSNGKIIQVKDYKKMQEFILEVIEGNVKFDKEEISNTILSKYSDKAFAIKFKETIKSLI